MAAVQLRVVAVVGDDPAAVGSPSQAVNKNWVREDVSVALRLSAVSAGSRLAMAGELAHRLPATRDALERGQLTVHNARYLCEAVAGLDDSDAATVQDAVLAAGVNQTVAAFQRSVRQAVMTVAPREAAERHTRALAERCVSATAAEDGMSTVCAVLPAEGTAALMSALSFRNVWVEYGEQIVLERINIEIASGTFLSVVGPSGAGKSTFLRLLLGPARPEQGSVRLAGEPFPAGRAPAPATLFPGRAWVPVLTGPVAAQDAKKLIVGKWEATQKGPENTEYKINAEFTEDGKLKIDIRTVKANGKYSFIDEKNIETETNFDGKTIKLKQKVTVTQDTLELEDPMGQVFKFKRAR